MIMGLLKQERGTSSVDSNGSATSHIPTVSTAIVKPQQQQPPQQQDPVLPESANQDPFFHRTHGYLYVPFKRTSAVPFAERVSAWIRQQYGAKVAGLERSRLEAMESKRNHLCAMSECTPDTFLLDAFQKTYLPAASSYINDLSSLVQKTQGTPYQGSVPGLSFTWSHWTHSEMQGDTVTASLYVELYGVLFNLAAAYSLIACLLPESLKTRSFEIRPAVVCEYQDALTHRIKMFRYAAAIFERLRVLLSRDEPTDGELHHDVMVMLRNVMLAQAQQCYYQIVKQQTYARPEKALVCAQLVLAAANYYKEFQNTFEKLLEDYQRVRESLVKNKTNAKEKSAVEAANKALNDYEREMNPHRHVPVIWLLHCRCVRAIVRAQVFMHYQQSISDRTDCMGERIVCVGRCIGILDEQEQLYHAEVSTKSFAVDSSMLSFAGPLLDAIRTLREAAKSILERLQTENKKAYHNVIPSVDVVLGKLDIKSVDKVALGDTPDFSSVPLLRPVYENPIDAFPSILSIASSNAWLQYRHNRIETYLAHLQVMKKADDALLSTLEAHPDYLFLYFIYQRLRTFVYGETPLSFFQTLMGADTLTAFNPTKRLEVTNVINKGLADLRKQASGTVANVQRLFEQLRGLEAENNPAAISGINAFEKRYAILSKEHELSTTSYAAQILDGFGGIQEFSERQTADFERTLTERLFGAELSRMLFGASLTKKSVAETGKKASVATARGYFTFTWASAAATDSESVTASGSGQSPALPEMSMAPATAKTNHSNAAADKELEDLVSSNPAVSAGLVISALLERQFSEREKAEDKLAQEFLSEITESKEIELVRSEVENTENWIYERSKWLINKTEASSRFGEAEGLLIGKLEELDAGTEALAEHLQSVLQRLVPKGSAAAGPVSCDVKPLFILFRDVVRLRQCKRFALLCKHMEDLVQLNAGAIQYQATEVLEVALKSSGKKPLRATRNTGGK